MPIRHVRRANGRLLAGVLIGAIAMFFVALGFVLNEGRAEIDRTQQALDRAEEAIRQNETALVALCAQRDDVDRRIRAERRSVRDLVALLREQKGPLVFSFPRRLLVQALQNDRNELRESYETRQNLEILDCEEEP